MARGVRDWCENFFTCNRHKTQELSCASMQPIYIGEPFERVAINIIGPLPKTESGNRYIPTVVDHFTKKVETYALANRKASTIALVFFKKFLSLYGVSYVLNTDQGLTSNLICLKSFVKCSISSRRGQLRITYSAMDKWSA